MQDEIDLTQIYLLIQQEVESIGFKKRRLSIFTRQLSDEVLGWLGIGAISNKRAGFVEINPVIGVRNQRIEKLVAELSNRKFHQYIPPTLSIHLGYLMPENRYTPWMFTSKDHQAIAKELAQSIQKYASSFIDENQTVDGICSSLQRGKCSIEPQRRYTLPVAYYLTGRTSEAETYISFILTKISSQQGLAVEEYKAFASRFLDLALSSSPTL